MQISLHLEYPDPSHTGGCGAERFHRPCGKTLGDYERQSRGNRLLRKICAVDEITTAIWRLDRVLRENKYSGSSKL
jgi:hypothetical protein